MKLKMLEASEASTHLRNLTQPLRTALEAPLQGRLEL